MVDKDGLVPQSHAEDCFISQRYFCDLFEGEVVALESILTKDKELRILRALTHRLPLIDSGIVPSQSRIANRMSHISRFKCIGKDRIGSEAVTHHADTLARLYHPLRSKAFCLLTIRSKQGVDISCLYTENKGHIVVVIAVETLC